MKPLHLPLIIALATFFSGGAGAAWDWDGASWADYRAFVSPISPAMKIHLQAIVATGQANGRVEGRLGQIGDSITESSAYFRNAVLNGVSNNETGHNYYPLRSWLAYSGTQPPDANSFYRDHGKGIDYGNLGGWRVPEATAAGHPERGVLVGDGVTPGEFSWGLVMFGTNDIYLTVFDVVAWKEDYRPLIQGYVALGVVPVLSTIPPNLAHLGDGRVEAANQAIRELADEELVPWVDFHGLVLHHQPVNWVGTLLGSDGVHPTAATDGRGFSQVAQTTTDGYALRTKLTYDMAEKLRTIVWNDGPPDPATAAPPGSRAGPELRASPNPFRAGTEITFGAGRRLAIIDVRGRLVRTLSASPSGSARWDGTDDRGRPVVAGVYFLREEGATAGPGRSRPVVRLR